MAKVFKRDDSIIKNLKSIEDYSKARRALGGKNVNKNKSDTEKNRRDRL